MSTPPKITSKAPINPKVESEGVRPQTIFHVGRKCPKGYKEQAGGIHLGRGIWLIRCEKYP